MVYPHTMHILVCVLSVLNIMEHAIDYLIFHSTHMVVPFLLQEPVVWIFKILYWSIVD